MGSGKDVVLSGTVSSKYVIDKAAEVAGGYVEKKEIRRQPAEAAGGRRLQPGDAARALRGSEPQRAAGARRQLHRQRLQERLVRPHDAPSSSRRPDFDSDKPGGLTFSDFLNVFLFNTKHGVGAVVKALQSKGLFQSLAEPNLIAQQRQGSELPRRRRISLSRRPVRRRQQRRDDHVQGVRRAPQLHADRARRRPDQPQGQARGQLARLRQRRQHLGASACRRSRRAAPRRKSSSRTGRRSRSPA